MGLYLCVFDGDDEVEGVEVGYYEDFGTLRDVVCERLEGGVAGSEFPVLMHHSDCDGIWSASEAQALQKELERISVELGGLAPVALPSGWKQNVAKSIGISPTNLSECFFDVDGEPLLKRMIGLCACAVDRRLPILFQ
jgi:hypothetical protein